MRPAQLFKTLYAKLAGTQTALFVLLAIAFLLATERMFEHERFVELAAELVVGAVLFSLLAGLLVFHVLTRRLQELTNAVARFRKSEFATPISLPSLRPDGDDIDRLGVEVQALSERMAAQLGQLADIDGKRRELLANVSHDLRTPLASMQGYLETLLLKHGTIPPEEERGYLEIAAKHSERLGRLVRDLFQLTRLEAHEVKPEPETFRISELAQDVLQKFSLRAERRGIRLDSDLPDRHIEVHADIAMIEGVLENLLENALRHTPSGGTVAIAVAPAGARVAVRVSDTGSGIARDQLSSVFDRYYRIDRGEMSDIGRTGLGLAIVRHVIDLHGGRIDVESEVGRGTTFNFDLPAAA